MDGRASLHRAHAVHGHGQRLHHAHQHVGGHRGHGQPDGGPPQRRREPQRVPAAQRHLRGGDHGGRPVRVGVPGAEHHPQLLLLRLRRHADPVRHPGQKVRRQVLLGRGHAHQLGVRAARAHGRLPGRGLDDRRPLHPGPRRGPHRALHARHALQLDTAQRAQQARRLRLRRRPARHRHLAAAERAAVPVRLRRRLALHLLRVRRRRRALVARLPVHRVRGPQPPPHHQRFGEAVHQQRRLGQGGGGAQRRALEGHPHLHALLGHPGRAHGPELRLRDAAHPAAHLHEADPARQHQGQRLAVRAALPLHVDLLQRVLRDGGLAHLEPRHDGHLHAQAAQRHRPGGPRAMHDRCLVHGLLRAQHRGAAVGRRGSDGRHHERVPHQPPGHLAALRGGAHGHHQLRGQRVRAARAPHRGPDHAQPADAGRLARGVLHQRGRVLRDGRHLPAVRLGREAAVGHPHGQDADAQALHRQHRPGPLARRVVVMAMAPLPPPRGRRGGTAHRRLGRRHSARHCFTKISSSPVYYLFFHVDQLIHSHKTPLLGLTYA